MREGVKEGGREGGRKRDGQTGKGRKMRGAHTGLNVTVTFIFTYIQNVSKSVSQCR